MIAAVSYTHPRKEAKKLSKEGWTTTPGSLPIEKQLDKAYMMSHDILRKHVVVVFIGHHVSLIQLLLDWE